MPKATLYGPRRSVIWLLAVCLVLESQSTASAQSAIETPTEAGVQLAEQKAAQAFEAYQNENYSAAVALYLDALKLAPGADILYNVARIYDMKLGDRELAMNFYRRYIADPGAVGERIQLANERLLILRDAERAAEQSPGAGAQAMPAQPAPARDSRPPPQGVWSTAQWTGVVAGAVGIVAVGVGAGFGLAAMSEGRTAKDLCDGNLCREQRGLDAAEGANDKALVSTIGFAAGGTLLAAAATLLIWGGHTKASDQPTPSGLSCEPAFVSDGAALGCFGAF